MKLKFVTEIHLKNLGQIQLLTKYYFAKNTVDCYLNHRHYYIQQSKIRK